MRLIISKIRYVFSLVLKIMNAIDKKVVSTYTLVQKNCLGFTDWKSKCRNIENLEWVINN